MTCRQTFPAQNVSRPIIPLWFPGYVDTQVPSSGVIASHMRYIGLKKGNMGFLLNNAMAFNTEEGNSHGEVAGKSSP